MKRHLTLLCLGLLSLRAAAAAIPESFAPISEAVTSFGAVVHNGWLYVFGGHLGKAHEYTRDTASGSLRRLNLAAGFAWEELAPTTPAQSPALVAHAGTLLRIAGMNARNAPGEPADLRSLADVERFDPGQAVWLPLPPLPAPRSSHDAVVVGNTLHVFGGWRLNGSDTPAQWHDKFLTLELNNPRAKWESHAQPFKRRALAVVAHKGMVYCLGGMDDSDSVSDAVDVLELRTGGWSRGPAVPKSRMKGFGLAACVAGGSLYITGFSGKIHRLNDAGDAWEPVGRLRQPRFFARLVAADEDTLLVVGGEGGSGHRADVEVVRLAADRQAGDWPQFRGPRRDGISRETGWLKQWPAGGPPVLWRRNLGKGLASFAVAGDRAYTLGNRGETDIVFCLDAATGREVWTRSYACPASAHKEAIVPGGPASTPLVADGRVFTLSRAGQLHCLDAETGNVVWMKHLVHEFGAKRPIYGYASSPLAHGRLLIVDAGGDDASTLALDQATGAVAWRAGGGEAGYSAAVVWPRGGRDAVALFKGEGLEVLDSMDGGELWRHPWETRDFCNVATPVCAGDYVFISSTSSNGAAMLQWAGERPEVVWRSGELGQLFNSAVLWQGGLIGFNDARREAKELTCLDARTGKVRWIFEGLDKGSFLVGDDHLLALSSKGELAVGPLTPGGFSVSSRVQVFGGRSYAPVVLARGRIFCRNNDGDAVCLDVRAPGAINAASVGR
jgi:outer membrane protein assembly factor BamB